MRPWKWSLIYVKRIQCLHVLSCELSVSCMPKISTGWVGRTNVTDRRQTDGTVAYSERERKFTFAKKFLGLLADPLAARRGLPGVRGPQFENPCIKGPICTYIYTKTLLTLQNCRSRREQQPHSPILLPSENIVSPRNRWCSMLRN